MVVVKADVLKANPWVADEMVRLLVEAEAKSGSANRYGVEANRKSLELVIQYCAQQGLIPKPYSVEELFRSGQDSQG